MSIVTTHIHNDVSNLIAAAVKLKIMRNDAHSDITLQDLVEASTVVSTTCKGVFFNLANKYTEKEEDEKQEEEEESAMTWTVKPAMCQGICIIPCIKCVSSACSPRTPRGSPNLVGSNYGPEQLLLMSLTGRSRGTASPRDTQNNRKLALQFLKNECIRKEAEFNYTAFWELFMNEVGSSASCGLLGARLLDLADAMDYFTENRGNCLSHGWPLCTVACVKQVVYGALELVTCGAIGCELYDISALHIVRRARERVAAAALRLFSRLDPSECDAQIALIGQRAGLLVLSIVDSCKAVHDADAAIFVGRAIALESIVKVMQRELTDKDASVFAAAYIGATIDQIGFSSDVEKQLQFFELIRADFLNTLERIFEKNQERMQAAKQTHTASMQTAHKDTVAQSVEETIALELKVAREAQALTGTVLQETFIALTPLIMGHVQRAK